MKKFYDSCYPDGKFPDSLEPLYSALGKIVYAWNYVEMFTDSCVAIIYHDYDGKAIAENHEIPRSFKNKVKFTN